MRQFTLIAFMLFCVNTFTQTISDLQLEKEKLLKSVEDNNNLINEYKDKHNSELLIISALDERLKNRNRLIQIYNNEIYVYTQQINTLSQRLDSLDKAIVKIKKDYSTIIYKQYLYKSSDYKLIFLFSSKSFNEFYRRFLYMSQITNSRKEYVEQLKEHIFKYNNVKTEVESKRLSVTQLLKETTKEKEKMKNELELRNSNIEGILSIQQNLEQQVLDAKKVAEELENRIVQLIEEEAKRIKDNDNEADYSYSDDMLSNKGKLLWPTKNHIVVSNFGQHEHPIYPSIIINNNGIDINVLDDLNVRPVNKGIVSRVIMIPGSNASVIVRHDKILTVYSNLSEVKVKKDQEVDINTILGLVYDGGGVNSNVLHFEIWIADEKQNPIDWLSK
jgi:murein DD-endopeptidase MepM/ murein hydrolase activator NlpD